MGDIYGGIEAGGTKFVLAAGSHPGNLGNEIRFPTTTPDETISRTIEYFRDLRKKYTLKALGISSFGPLDLHKTSSSYGYITNTPKPGWTDTDFAMRIRRALNIPLAFDTDVNTAALAEHYWGAARNLTDFIYLTIGTGIGGGGMTGGNLMHGLIHPEMGHIMIPHDTHKDPYKGFCPFHGDCFEGLAAGPAIEGRWGKRGEMLDQNHAAWALEAHYIASALVNYILILSPQRIILGGGVMQQVQLFPMIRREVKSVLNQYVRASEINTAIDRFIVPAELKNHSGVLGAIALARLEMNDAP